MSILVIDVGTTSVRAGVVRPDATVAGVQRRPLPPIIPGPGLVEFDADAMAAAALDAAAAAIASMGPVDAVGVTNQRGSAVVWDAETGRALGPGLGWQDLRTVGTCLELQAEGLRLAPNESATKVAWLLDTYAPERPDRVRWGTIDSWIVWHLTRGTAHVTDHTNAGITGLLASGGSHWDAPRTVRLGIPEGATPQLVDSSGVIAPAVALPGAPPITGIIGDQQASLLGQGCTRRGMAKITFGTGAMLDVALGPERPTFDVRGAQGCFPIVTRSQSGALQWGVEAVMLTAGSAVDWLVEDLEILSSAAESEQVAAACSDTDGVVMVPALNGLGAPAWDFGARGTLFGLARGTKRAQLVRAVLEGVAQRGADLVEAAQADTGLSIEHLRVDGGMSANSVFVQALANAAARPVEVSPEVEATTLGAGFAAGLATGAWGADDVAASWRPQVTVEPGGTAQRERWADAVGRTRAWYPELSALGF
jgi:glycerol kinase